MLNNLSSYESGYDLRLQWKKQPKAVEKNRGGGGYLGIFWVGMCRPGLQIGTPF